MKTIKKTKMIKTAVFLMVLVAVLSLNIISAAGRSEGTTDAAYANFRNVMTGRIGRNNLFRSQHPANGSARAPFANMLMEKNGIQTVLDLSDSEKTLQRYFTKNNITSSYYYKSLYDRRKIYTAHLKTDHQGSSYPQKVADGLRFFAKYKGPYLVHCEVGRDRTGFVILLLESLMGAPYGYMVNDFAQTYVNREYSYEQAQEKAIRHTNEEFSYMTGKNKNTNWKKVNLAVFAEKYLINGGMTYAEISALKRNLSASYSYGGTTGNMMVSYPKEDDTQKQGADSGKSGKTGSSGGKMKTGLDSIPSGNASTPDEKTQQAVY